MKEAVAAAKQGKVVVVRHRWDGKVPGGYAKTIVKVLCCDRGKLAEFGRKYGLPEGWIHDTRLPHFDLWGEKAEKLVAQLTGAAQEGESMRDGLSPVVFL